MNNWIGYIASVLGLAIVVAGWFVFGDQSHTNIFVLNIIVSLVAYVVIFVDMLIPWANVKDKTQSRIGNSGVRWFVQYGYSITAIILLVVSNLLLWPFTLSLLVQCALAVLLLLGLAVAKASSAKIVKVSQMEAVNINCVQLMRDKQDSVLEAAYDAAAPQDVINQIKSLGDALRYISPSNSQESRKVERDIIELFAAMKPMFNNYEINKERIDANIVKAERLIKKRKSTYSN